MKEATRLIVIVAFLLTSVIVRGQKSDTVAQRIVEKNLNIIEGYLNDTKSDPSLKRAASIAFLTDLTGIPSTSPGDYIGQYNPSQMDLMLWKNWYTNNKQNISWDKEKVSIVFHKVVKPPKFE